MSDSNKRKITGEEKGSKDADQPTFNKAIKDLNQLSNASGQKSIIY